MHQVQSCRLDKSLYLGAYAADLDAVSCLKLTTKGTIKNRD